MLKLWATKKLKLTARKGSAALMSVLIAAALSGIIGYSSVKLTSANLNAVKATNISTQAEQYAKARAGLIRATKYDDLAASGKTSLADGNYKIEVLKGSESVYDATNKINQRTMTVNVYNGSDSSPIYSLAVPRFSKEASGAGESYVTESWHSGSEGYRVWSDGFIEQWGSFYDPSGWQTITFRKPFTTCASGCLAITNADHPVGVNYYSLSKTAITLVFDSNGIWKAWGY